MEDLANKVDGDQINGGEWIQQPQEIQNLITDSGQALNGGDLRQLAKATAIVVNSKAQANAIPIIEDGRKVFITSPDGGEFTMRTGQPIGTYNDNGGTLTGTQFTPGDGSTGFERDTEGVINSKWFENGIIPGALSKHIVINPSVINFNSDGNTESFRTILNGIEFGDYSSTGATRGIKGEVTGVDARFLFSTDTSNTRTILGFTNSNGNVGNIQVSGSATIYATSSDKTRKKSYGLLKNASDIINKIEIHNASFKSDKNNTIIHCVMAQDCYEVYPQAISKPKKKGDSWGADYSKFTPLLIAHNQELEKRIERLEKIIEGLIDES